MLRLKDRQHRNLDSCQVKISRIQCSALIHTSARAVSEENWKHRIHMVRNFETSNSDRLRHFGASHGNIGPHVAPTSFSTCKDSFCSIDNELSKARMLRASEDIQRIYEWL